VLDERLRALAHPARRRMLDACLARDHTAGELVDLTGLPNPSVSEHLKVLRKTGLLIQERDGRFRRYRADRQALDEVLAALATLGSLHGD
jgi:DNA-binding transcriptional ArsR family regulator